MPNEKGINDKISENVSEIPFKDNIFLSPLEKYKIYGRFPWKMIVHILLVIATTAQAILIISQTTQYTRAQERLFYNYFISDSDKTSLDYPRIAYLYSVNQLKNHIKSSIRNYYDIQINSLENMEYLTTIEDLFILLEFNYIDKKNIPSKSSIPREMTYKINNLTMGPFDFPDDDVKSFLNSVISFRFNYTIKTYVPFYYGDHYQCFQWEIFQIYSFEHRAHFVTELKIMRSSCDDVTHISGIDYFINRLMWIHIVVLILAMMSMILTWKYVYKMAKFYWRIKRGLKGKNDDKDNKDEDKDKLKVENNVTKYENEDEYYNKLNEEEGSEHVKVNPKAGPNKKQNDNTWNKLKNKDKKLFFNMWSVLCLLGNIIQIFGSSLSLFDTDNVMSSTEILVGFGCMFAYMNVGRYLEYNREYSTIFATISRAMPNVLRYLLGVMPIFFGFIFFGLCLFWRSERFVSTSSTMMTLFAMLNGDSVYDIFRDLSGISFVIGQIYCYIFCIIFIVVVMNVFISIIEESYVSTKMKNQNHWIYSYLKIDPKYVQINDLEELKNKGQENEASSPEGAKQINRGDKTQKAILSKVKSKNILREAMADKIKLKAGSQTEITKADFEKRVDLCFNNIENSLMEVENISRDLSGSEDNKMKDEMRLFIFEHITTLENKMNSLKEIWIKS